MGEWTRGMPVKCRCINPRCKHQDVKQIVKLVVAPGTHIIMRPSLWCANCLSEMKIEAPGGWAD